MLNKKNILFLFLSVFLIFISNIVFAQTTKQTSNIFLIKFKSDPEFLVKKRYAGFFLDKKFSHERAINMAIKESKIKLRALNIEMKFSVITVLNIEDALKKIKDQVFDGSAVILDLPFSIMIEVVKNFKRSPYAFFNARNNHEGLRESVCQLNFFHTIASQKMYTDAIAQFLIIKNWKKVIIIFGDDLKDKSNLEAFVKSGKKFGLNVKKIKKFSMSRNSLDKFSNNNLLLTSGSKYDVVVVFDDFGEFSRYMPYNIYLPRPVIGDIGLTPKVWHWSWDRFGSPQLNQRFNRKNVLTEEDYEERKMSDQDWSAWASVKAIIESLKKHKNGEKINLTKLLRSKDLKIDLYKGSPGSFRHWNNQLRQPILMTTSNAVIAKVPTEKFLHPKHNEDTIGIDELESKCVF